MKRIIICSVLTVCAVIISLYAYFRVEGVNDELNTRIDSLIIALGSDNNEEIIKQAHSLTDYWDEEEGILIHFIRHSYIDVITTSVARLPALAEYGDYSEVYAELLSIRRQVEHMRTSEVLTLKNLL